jgi:hypothetical protein
MKSKMKVFLSILFISVLLTSNHVLAVRKNIYLPKKQAWVSTQKVTRSKNYSFGYAACYSVYPLEGGKDKFTKVQVRMKAGSTAISKTYTLSESATNFTRIKIKEGYLSKTKVVFDFRGNHPDYSARTDVEYLPK